MNFCKKSSSDSSSRSDYDFYSQALDSLFQSDRMVILRDSIVDANRLEYQNDYYIRPNFQKPLSAILKDSLDTKVKIQTISLKRYNAIKERPGLTWMNFYDTFSDAVGFVTLSKIYRQEELSKAYFVVNLECGNGCDRSYEITLGIKEMY